jgi:hypothetical protein
MPNPKHKLTIGSTVFECEVLTDAKVTQLEDSFDNATIILDDVSIYTSGLAVPKETITLEVTNEGNAYPTNPLFSGMIRFPIVEVGDKNRLTLSCLGTGYGLGNMAVAEEYGSQSRNNTLNTITEILTDSSNGIIPAFVNKKLNDTASGYSYDVSATVETISDDIPYICFPYKPAHNSINDLVDLISAIKAPAAGCHWIVTTDSKFRLKTVGTNQSGWTKYFSGATNTDAKSTLSYGEDYEASNFQHLPMEINTVVYYGLWRRPSNGDGWTENDISGWGSSGVTLSSDATYHIVGAKSLRATADNTNLNSFYYPTAKNAAWNITTWGNGSSQYIPTLNFYVSKNTHITNLLVEMHTDAANFFTTQQIGYGTTYLTEDNKFYHFTIPIGQLWDDTNAPDTKIVWSSGLGGTGDWSNINWVSFSYTNGATEFINIDGFHFGSIPLCRVATNSDITPDAMTFINDNQGKDDSLIAADDSGVMAQLAKAALLRETYDAYVGSLKTQMFQTALPGQLWHTFGADYRATKLEHEIHADKYSTTLYLTDDLINGKTRIRYDDLNKVNAAIRPEWQDRQAASIKANGVDWTIPRLVKDYA